MNGDKSHQKNYNPRRSPVGRIFDTEIDCLERGGRAAYRRMSGTNRALVPHARVSVVGLLKEAGVKRDGLSAGGTWIRTIGSSWAGARTRTQTHAAVDQHDCDQQACRCRSAQASSDRVRLSQICIGESPIDKTRPAHRRRDATDPGDTGVAARRIAPSNGSEVWARSAMSIGSVRTHVPR